MNNQFIVLDGTGDGFYVQPSLPFYCEGYPTQEAPHSLPHPSFIMPPEVHRMHMEQANSGKIFH